MKKLSTAITEKFEVTEDSVQKSNPKFNALRNKETGSPELDAHLAKKFKKYDVFPAHSSTEIFTGFLCKYEDSTWNDVYSYYYNNNYPGEFSIKQQKI